MTEKQIKMLRSIIKQEIESAGIDGMEHGAWGWAEKQLDESWALHLGQKAGSEIGSEVGSVFNDC